MRREAKDRPAMTSGSRCMESVRIELTPFAGVIRIRFLGSPAPPQTGPSGLSARLPELPGRYPLDYRWVSIRCAARGGSPAGNLYLPSRPLLKPGSNPTENLDEIQ